MLDQLERTLTDLIARFAPWLSPLPTAYLTAHATTHHLHWPTGLGIVAGVIVESLGLAAVNTAIELYDYNLSRRKSDPAAPLWVAMVLAGLYFAAVTGLTVMLDTSHVLAVYAPLVFPLLSLAGVTVLALRADHRRRIEAIAQEKIERSTIRNAQRTAQHIAQHNAQIEHRDDDPSAQHNAQNDALDAINRTRQEKRSIRMNALLDAYKSNPQLGPTDAAKLLGAHRNTIYGYIEELETSGRLWRNGDGWEVVG